MGNEKNKSQQALSQPVAEELIFKVVKEIVVKFIEVGKVTPGNFDKNFDKIYKSVKRTVGDT